MAISSWPLGLTLGRDGFFILFSWICSILPLPEDTAPVPELLPALRPLSAHSKKMHHHSISVQSSFVTKVTQNKSWTKGQGNWESLEGQEILNILCFKPWALEGTHANKLSLGLEIRAL